VAKVLRSAGVVVAKRKNKRRTKLRSKPCLGTDEGGKKQGGTRGSTAVPWRDRKKKDQKNGRTSQKKKKKIHKKGQCWRGGALENRALGSGRTRGQGREASLYL